MPHRKKILLSDSNEAFSMLLADSLRERGNFHVFHAKDEDETTRRSTGTDLTFFCWIFCCRTRAAFTLCSICARTGTKSRRFL